MNPLVAVLAKFGALFRPADSSSLPTVVGSDDHVLPPPNQLTAEPMAPGTSGGGDRNAGISLFGDAYDSSRDRMKALADYDMIDDNVPELSRALTMGASMAMCGEPDGADETFKIEYDDATPDADREEVDDLLLRRLAMQHRVVPIARAVPKAGDGFFEEVLDQDGTIWSLRYLEPKLTHRVHDEFGRLKGFRFEGFAGDAGAGGSKTKLLEPWRVLHARYDAQEGYRYGRSLLANARAIAYRTIAVRDALAYEVCNHATARNLIMVERPYRWSPQEVEDWLDDMTDRLSREQVVDSSGNLNRRMLSILNGQDVVLAYPGGQDQRASAPTVTPLTNAPVRDLVAAAEHFQDMLAVAAGFPRSLLGIERGGEGIGGNRLGEQIDQLARTLRALQRVIADMLVELVRRQFVLYRRPIAEGAFRIVMPNLTRVDELARAQIWKLRMEAAVQAALVGMPADMIWHEVVWAGDLVVARDRAKTYGWDPATWALRALPAAGQAAPALPPSTPGKSQPTVEQMVEEIRAAERARAALRGVVMANRAVRFGRGE